MVAHGPAPHTMVRHHTPWHGTMGPVRPAGHTQHQAVVEIIIDNFPCILPNADLSTHRPGDHELLLTAPTLNSPQVGVRVRVRFGVRSLGGT